MNITQPGRESFNCYSLILSDWELFCLVPDAPPVSALFLLAAFSGPGLLSLHLNLSLCLREETPERERETGRGICEMRQVLSGQSGQSGSQWAGRGCHSVSWAGQ